MVPGSIPRIILSSTFNSTDVFGNIKIRKSFGVVIKVVVFIGVLCALYTQLSDISLNDFRKITIHNWSYLIAAIALVSLNWGIEFIKWRLITKPLLAEGKSRLLFRSLFAGIATGIVTPNRLGNFVGRMLYFKGKKRILAALGTLYANLSQFIATLIFGAIGLYAVGEKLLSNDQLYFLKITLVIVLSSAFFVYIIFAFGPRIFLFLYRRHKNTVAVLQDHLHDYSFILLLLSLLRYIIFVSQFGFLLLAFGASYSDELIYALYLHFMITSILPSLLFGKLVIRETVALIILGSFIADDALIIFSSLSLWIINLGIPSLLGTYFLFSKRNVNVI